MTLPESIVTSLKWSQKLGEAGWPQKNALYYWHKRRSRLGYWGLQTERSIQQYLKYTKTHKAHQLFFAAPTAEELLRRLPTTINGRQLMVLAGKYDWRVAYYYDPVPAQDADTIANAAAAMYCYLAEHDLLPAA
jgi:hypothetical protein